MKRILSFLLIVVLVFSLFPISAFAEELNPAILEEGEGAADDPTDGEPADGESADGENTAVLIQ